MVNSSELWQREVLEIESRSKDREDIDIVFYGSSSIRLWHTLNEDFESYKVLNHGFGGSKLKDAIYYYDRLVKPFNPRLVVVFSGSNDIDKTYKKIGRGRLVFSRFKKFFKKHVQTLNTPMIYIAITPSIARWKLRNQVQIANRLIERYALKHDQLYVLDVTEDFLEHDYPNEDLFVGDGLHLTKQGYKIWVDALKPMVDDLLK